MASRDNLGIFGHQDDSTGEFDVDALRKALEDKSAAPPPPPRVRAQRSRVQRASRQAAKKRRRRRLQQSVLALLVLSLIGGGVFFLVRTWSTPDETVTDFSGAGTSETIIRIRNQDGALAVGQTLFGAGVIASAQTYVSMAEGNSELAQVQSGYYKVKQQASVESTITALIDPANRVGKVELKPGGVLADVVSPADPDAGTAEETIPGFITLLTEAACVPLNGMSNCFTAEDLWKVARTGSLTELGLVSWAQGPVAAAPEPDRRLEGMILPGVYNIPPGNDPVAVLQTVLSESAVAWTTTNLSTRATEGKYTEYELVVIASIVQKEAITEDMAKVSRVIYNRLEDPDFKPYQRLQMDSTINYFLNISKLLTSSTARDDPTSPYNTYQHPGLPPTPISSPGADAIQAALSPAAGDWEFFVAKGSDGRSCFSVTAEQHEICKG